LVEQVELEAVILVVEVELEELAAGVAAGREAGVLAVVGK